MKRLLCLLVPLVAFGTAALTAQRADDNLHLMTFNIRYGTADDGANSWPNRQALVADIIDRYSPDVLAIQEGLAFQLEDLAEVLDDYRKLGQHRDGGQEGEFSGLFVDEGRVRVMEWGEFWLSPTPYAQGSIGWDAALPRMAVWADLEVLGSGEIVRVYGTHFDHRGETARLESARLIARHAEDAPTALVMGDFNAGEDSEPVRAFLEHGYRSAYSNLHSGDQTGTFNGFSDPAGGNRIDHILLSPGLQPRKAEIVDDQVDGVWPSDHFAVTAVVSTSPAVEPIAGAKNLLDSEALSGLGYRYIGPPGNRAIAVAGIPGDPLTYYVGAASGGIWKTTDGGTHWDPIFDDQPVSSIGALAIAPSDPEIIWAGTGETFLRSHISLGWGAFKSTDAGDSWHRVGLERTGRIGRIVIHPTNPDVVLVAALGHAQGPQEERGIYRTADGGESWDKVLFVNDSTGAIDIVMSPEDPDLLFAAMWQIEMKTWGRVSGGPGSGIWTSRDGGVTWTRLEGDGLPTRPFGKVGLAMTPGNPDRIYALIETGRGLPWNGEATDDGALWRSDDRGESWELVNSDSYRLLTRPAYYTRMAVSPDNQDEAYFLTIFFSSTSDAGASIDQRPSGASPGFDNHDIWIDPTDGDRMIVANDEGVGISLTRGQSWNRIKLPIAQIYRVTTDNQVPYTVCGNMQDGPSTCGPSNSKMGGGAITGGADIPRGLWYSVGGGESGTATPDPVDPDIVWSTASGRGSAGGIVVRHNRRTGETRDVEVWPVATFGHAAADLRFRFIWDFPIAISPHDHNRVYVASQFLHVSTDGGASWQIISPDLTLNDKSKQVHSGGITPDNLGVEYGNTIYSIAESRLEPGLIWVGTNDGVVQVTRDGGTSWKNVTENIPGMIPWGTVSNIEPSSFHPGAAYITVNGHQEGNFDPWVYRTEDYGAGWELIVDGIMESPLSYARNIREDPVRPGLLYLATENAMYVSFDDGDRWQPLQLNLPHAPVSWLTIQEHFNDLVLSTYGRGFWILDDLSPLQQLTKEVVSSETHLFRPRDAYRFRLLEDGIREMSDDPTAGDNPPYGASLSYWLKDTPEGSVLLTIENLSGREVTTLEGTTNRGINRLTWDLREGQNRGGAQGGGGPPGTSARLLQPPGVYRVTLRVGGTEHTQQLTVLKDPDSAGSLQDIAVQFAMMRELSENLQTAEMLSRKIDTIRSQLNGLMERAGDDFELKEEAETLEGTFAALADCLVQQKPGGFFMWPGKLISKLIYLATHVQSSDHPPTQQAREAHAVLRELLDVAVGEFKQVVQEELAGFNDLLRDRGLPIIEVVPPGG